MRNIKQTTNANAPTVQETQQQPQHEVQGEAPTHQPQRRRFKKQKSAEREKVANEQPEVIGADIGIADAHTNQIKIQYSAVGHWSGGDTRGRTLGNCAVG